MGANDKVAATFHGADPLDQIRARLEAATPGPWEAVGRSIENAIGTEDVVSCDVECGSYCYGGRGEGVQSESNATLIANAPSDIRRLLNALEVVRGVREQNAYDESDQMYTQGWNDALREVEHRIRATLEQS